jgi:hypothetical protein
MGTSNSTNGPHRAITVNARPLRSTDDVTGIELQWKVDRELLPSRLAANGDRQRAGGEVKDVSGCLDLDRLGRRTRVKNLSGDLRAREQRIAFRARGSKRIDEARRHGGDQSLGRDVAARLSNLMVAAETAAL